MNDETEIIGRTLRCTSCGASLPQDSDKWLPHVENCGDDALIGTPYYPDRYDRENTEQLTLSDL